MQSDAVAERWQSGGRAAAERRQSGGRAAAPARQAAPASLFMIPAARSVTLGLMEHVDSDM